MNIFNSARRIVMCVAAACAFVLRKRLAVCAALLAAGVYSALLLTTYTARLPRVDMMEQKVQQLQAQISFLESLYHARHEEVLNLQTTYHPGRSFTIEEESKETTMTPQMAALMKNISGTLAARGVSPRTRLPRSLFVHQLLPHLLSAPGSLRAAYHLRARNATLADIVVGLPTVRRDKENYLMITLTHLVDGMSEEDQRNTVIVVFVAETDLAYVLHTASQIELKFPKQVASGVIEVLSPAASFYPDLSEMSPTLGDSEKRFRWRTKQNLDTIYLMAYAKTRGTYYLMIEDDVICTKTYMQEIKEYTASVSVSNPGWVFIEFCPVGGIGKLFRSAELLRFVTYVQLFYRNMPVDWLLESFLADQVCTIEKGSDKCGKSKVKIRPRYSKSLFQHIGLYSSLKGKIQKVKGSGGAGKAPAFYPHDNPPLASASTDIREHGDHTAMRAYHGLTFFWGVKPSKGNYVEFVFEKPTVIDRFLFRSSNVEHPSDKFYGTVVEAQPAGRNYTALAEFDEFGLAEGSARALGPLASMRLRVTSNSSYWVILSEIELKSWEKPSR